jgi:hypothetical protein
MGDDIPHYRACLPAAGLPTRDCDTTNHTNTVLYKARLAQTYHFGKSYSYALI